MTELPREFPLPSDAFERQRFALGARVAAGRSTSRLPRRRAVAAVAAIVVGGLLVAPALGIGSRLLALIAPGTGAEMSGVAWSPDGRRIAYYQMQDESWELHVVNADGSGERVLGSAETWCSLAWSPDGTRLAVRRSRDGHDEFSVVNADGSGALTLKRVTAQAPNWCTGSGPAWSPDGRKLVFTADGKFLPSGVERGSEVLVVNADGSGRRKLTRNRARDFRASFSPDGRKITFVTDRSGGIETWVMNPDGSGQARLTRSDGGAWSPDGRRFAFQRDGSVFVVNADGSGERRLTRIPRKGTKRVFSYGTSWSPDGRYVDFASGNLMPPGGVFFDAYVVRADGSGRWRLPFSGPGWSPDGRKILLVRQQGNPSEIFAVNPDGSGLRNLTRNPTHDGSPAWSPDGRTIAFVSRRDGNYGIYLMNPDGSGQRRLTDG